LVYNVKAFPTSALAPTLRLQLVLTITALIEWTKILNNEQDSW